MRTRGSQNKQTTAHRRALLDAALAEFIDRGIAGATLDSICARVGVTKGSAYHHFASKERIAVSLYAEAIAAIHAEVHEGMTAGESAREHVEGLVSAYLGWFERNPRHGSFVFTVMDGRGLDAGIEDIRATQVDFIRACVAWLTPFVERGDLRPTPPDLYVSVIIGPSRDFLRRWLPRPTARAMREAKRVLPATAWRSVAARPSRD